MAQERESFLNILSTTSSDGGKRDQANYILFWEGGVIVWFGCYYENRLLNVTSFADDESYFTIKLFVMIGYYCSFINYLITIYYNK